MPHHQWSILCTRATVDKLTNNISLIEIIDEISVEVDPTVDLSKPLPTPLMLAVSAVVVSAYTRTDPSIPEKTIGRLTLHGPPGSSLFTPANFDIDLTQFIRTRCLIGIAGLPIEMSGMHSFSVDVQTSTQQFAEVARVPFEIKLTHGGHVNA